MQLCKLFIATFFRSLDCCYYNIIYICKVEYVLFINMLYDYELYMMAFLVVICAGMGRNHELLNE